MIVVTAKHKKAERKHINKDTDGKVESSEKYFYSRADLILENQMFCLRTHRKFP